MKRVLILFGGNSYEHNISCKSANYIINNIDKEKFLFDVVGIDHDFNWFIVNTFPIDENWKNNTLEKVNNILDYLKDFDVVFPIIHGNTGEDGKLQSIFEALNIKYVGTNSYCSFICYSKILTKLVLEKYNIPEVPYLIYDNKLNIDLIEFPVIVKPSKCGSSIGITVAHNKKELKKAIKIAYNYDKNILIERYIKNNRELECAIITKKKKITCSNVGEILKRGTFYDYKSKYIDKTSTKIADISDDLSNTIKNLSKKIFTILGCKSLSRVDFLYDIDEGKLYFNEINTIPGMTEVSMYPTLINDTGINSKDLISILLDI